MNSDSTVIVTGEEIHLMLVGVGVGVLDGVNVGVTVVREELTSLSHKIIGKTAGRVSQSVFSLGFVRDGVKLIDTLGVICGVFVGVCVVEGVRVIDFVGVGEGVSVGVIEVEFVGVWVTDGVTV